MTPRSVLLERAAPVLYWVMLFIALAILLRGHNEPGGGFIGGLVAVAASALLAVILGPASAVAPAAAGAIAAGGLRRSLGLTLLSGLPALYSRDCPI
jgi:multicomponent Na+:H+ antiporter subunit B